MRRREFIQGISGIAGILTASSSPAIIIRSLIGARQQTVSANDSVPFDSVIEYLESDGTQWIDTMTIPSPDNEFRFKVRLPLDGAWAGVYSDQYPSNGDTNMLHLIKWNNRIDVVSVRHFMNSGHDQIRNAIGSDYIAECIFTKRFGSINGVSRTLYFQAAINNSLKFFTSENASGGRIYYFTVENQMDLVPVRKGEFGYLYDTISGAMLGSADPENPFVGDCLGPDVSSPNLMNP